MISQNRTKTQSSIHHKRLPIKGFNWISQQTIKSNINPLCSKAFKNFRIDDQKKKWKIKNCQNFKGFSKRIQQLLKHKQGLHQQNTNKIKQQLLLKQVEEISLKNTFDKMDKLKQVTTIYQKQKIYKVNTIENFFNQQILWIQKRFH